MTVVDGDWHADGVRVGRATRTVEVAGPDGPTTIEAGSVHFDLLCDEDPWTWRGESWMQCYFQQGFQAATDPDVVRLSYEHLGTIRFPEGPLPPEAAYEWLEEHPEAWRPLLDEVLESDVTAADVLNGGPR